MQHPELKIGMMDDYNGASAELGCKIAEECTDSLAALVNQLDDSR